MRNFTASSLSSLSFGARTTHRAFRSSGQDTGKPTPQLSIGPWSSPAWAHEFTLGIALSACLFTHTHV